MFTQLFLLVAGLVIMGTALQSAQWLLACCGAIMAIGAAVTLYQIKTGK